MQEIRKTETPKLILLPAEEEWKTVDEKRQAGVTKALANPIRCKIYNELGLGPVRQSELAKRISKVAGKKISNALLRHHLHLLARAELVEMEMSPEKSKVKLVYRAKDARVQLRTCPRGSGVGREPLTHEEFVTELKRTFKKPPAR